MLLLWKCNSTVWVSVSVGAIGQHHWISIHIDNAIASFSVLLICIMSTVFDCLWSCFLSWNILEFILSFCPDSFLFSSPPSLCLFFIYFALLRLLVLLLPQLMTTNTQMVSLSPSLSALSVFHTLLVPVVPFKLSVWLFHPFSLHIIHTLSFECVVF